MIKFLNKENRTKKVIPFFDYFDNIPYNAKYLFSLKQQVSQHETEEEKNMRLIADNPEEYTKPPIVSYLHYYEVNNKDFEEMKKNGFLNLSGNDKINKFKKECGIK